MGALLVGYDRPAVGGVVIGGWDASEGFGASLACPGHTPAFAALYARARTALLPSNS